MSWSTEWSLRQWAERLKVEAQYSALANVFPGIHLSALIPIGTKEQHSRQVSLARIGDGAPARQPDEGVAPRGGAPVERPETADQKRRAEVVRVGRRELRHADVMQRPFEFTNTLVRFAPW
jgi:hypothetical protein